MITTRFIAGKPCMYFGTSSYVCWIELGKWFETALKSSEFDKAVKYLDYPEEQKSWIWDENSRQFNRRFEVVWEILTIISKQKRAFSKMHVLGLISLSGLGGHWPSYPSQAVSFTILPASLYWQWNHVRVNLRHNMKEPCRPRPRMSSVDYLFCNENRTSCFVKDMLTDTTYQGTSNRSVTMAPHNDQINIVIFNLF